MCNNPTLDVAEYMPIASEYEAEPTSSALDTSDQRLKTHMENEFLEKMNTLRCLLEVDIVACDAKWTLFVSAALSYRYDIRLRPMPPQRYLNEYGTANINLIVAIINEAPRIHNVLHHIIEQDYNFCLMEALELMYWVLIELPEPTLRTLGDDEYDTLLKVISMKENFVKPTHVFQVCYSYRTNAEEKFRRLQGDHPTKLAFYGNKLDHFYAIINGGFCLPWCNESLLLNAEVSSSLLYSPKCPGWGASQCGAMLACSCLCEYVNNPEHIQRLKEDGGDSLDSDVIVQKGEMIRPRYLFMYGNRCPVERQSSFNIFNWFARYKYCFSLACYLVLFGSITAVNSGNCCYLKQLFNKKALFMLEFWKRFFMETV